jgi:hypothetical protein
MSLGRELAHRRAEQRARLMVRVANRTFKKQPNRGDRLARRLLDKAVTSERSAEWNDSSAS